MDALHEAEYYAPQNDGSVKCLLCPRGCQIREGQCGKCKSRINRGGRLYASAYDKVCALQVDPIEKKPLLHFYPGADVLSLGAAGCNLSCLNCQNWSVSQAAPSDVAFDYLTPSDIVTLSGKTNSRLVAYTYTEPLTYMEYVRDCTVPCHKAGLKNILVSAGYVNERPLKDLLPFLDAANVDLKSFSDDIYRHISNARLSPILRTLLLMKEAGIWLEITNLVIPTVNDDPAMIKKMCQWLVKNGFENNPLHFSRFFPQYKLLNLPPTPLNTLLNAGHIAKTEGMKFVYIGNTDIPDAEDTYCPHCGKLLVKRDGYRIVKNLMTAAQCPYCKEEVPGIWI